MNSDSLRASPSSRKAFLILYLPNPELEEDEDEEGLERQPGTRHPAKRRPLAWIRAKFRG